MSRLETARLTLRRARPEDLGAFHAILSDSRAMRYWSSLPHRSLDESRTWLEAMIASPTATSDDYVIELDGEVIGKAGFYRLPEIGFILHPDYWRKGFAREALEAVIERAFSAHDVEALTADVDPRNEASLGLLKSLGFVETGRAQRTFTLGEEECDSIYLALPRP